MLTLIAVWKYLCQVAVFLFCSVTYANMLNRDGKNLPRFFLIGILCLIAVIC